MISMTKPGGYIVFDVMDKNSLCCLKCRWNSIKEKYFKLLGIHVDEQYGEHFVSLWRLKIFLKKEGLSYHYWREQEITKNKDIFNTPKVVFCCRKKG